MTAGRGLLIVNADDWGYDRETTEAIADSHRAGGVTSTTAMVWMRDSTRASERARELPGLGVGLHLNLVEELSDPDVPRSVRDRQRRFIEYFRLLRLRRWVYDPKIRHEANRLVADQFQRFHDLYGRPPTHLDGHHHCHLALNVLLSPALPAGIKIRRPLSSGVQRRNRAVELLRARRDRSLVRRFPTTDWFLSVRSLWPAFGGADPEAALGLAARGSLEVMVHPAFPDEYELLTGEAWTNALAGRTLGTFADLRP